MIVSTVRNIPFLRTTMPLSHPPMSTKLRDEAISYPFCFLRFFLIIANNISNHCITRTKFMHLASYTKQLMFVKPSRIIFTNGHCRGHCNGSHKGEQYCRNQGGMNVFHIYP